jgi:hypothetical protein
MDSALLPTLLSILGVAVIAYLARVVVRNWRSRNAMNAAMAALAFKPCPDDIPPLQTTVRALHDDADLDIRHAEKLDTRGGPVYRYEVRSTNDENVSANEEFLLPLQRKSDRPVVLYMLPEGLIEGRARTLLEKLTATLSPPRLAPIVAPQALRSAILSALGPPGADLFDLIDDRQLTQLRHAARLGFFVARASGSHCALEVLPVDGRRMLPSFDLAAAARYVRELAERPSTH